VLLSVGVVTVFYLIAAYTQVAGFGFDMATIGATAGAPLFALGAPTAAGGFGSVAIDRILELVVLLDILAVGVGAAVASTRGVFAMARDRRLPAPLAKVSPRFGTPTGAIVLLTVVNVAFVAVNEFFENVLALPGFPHYFSIFAWASTFGGFALVVVYLMMSVGALVGLSQEPKKLGLVIAALVGIALTGGAIYGSFYKVQSPTLLAPWFALLWFILGLVVTLLVKGRAPASETLTDLRSDGGVSV
jgi:amino acid transporter